MNSIINIFFFVALAGTVLSLIIGIVNFFRPSPNGTLANTTMRLRVLFQFLAILLFSIMMSLR